MTLKRLLLVASLSALGCVVPLRPAVAGEPPGDFGYAPGVFERLAFQERRIAALEARLASRPAAPPPWVEGSDRATTDADGLQSTHDEGWTYEWGGAVFFDYVNFAEQDAGSLAAYGDINDYFESRKLRLVLRGKGYGVLGYKVQLDFAAEAVEMEDVYLSIDELPWLGKLVIGNWDVPLFLEEITDQRFITFLERSLPILVWSVDRKPGVVAAHHSADENLTWAYGAFFADVDLEHKERIDDRQGISLAGRATWTPFYQNEGRHLVLLGAAAHWKDEPNDLVSFGTRGCYHVGPRMIETGAIPADSHVTGNLEAAVVWGPLSVQGQLVVNRTQGTLGHPDVDTFGAYVFASFFLTGEHRGYERHEGIFDRVTPLENFWFVRTADGPSMGSGAWELAVRWSYVDLNGPGITGPLRGELHEVTMGLNWYWSPYTRMMLNYIRPMGDLDLFGHTDTHILSARCQVDF
jgi:phosphate-selective porin OprO/OprP